jgi:hypothetical protein
VTLSDYQRETIRQRARLFLTLHFQSFSDWDLEKLVELLEDERINGRIYAPLPKETT